MFDCVPYFSAIVHTVSLIHFFSIYDRKLGCYCGVYPDQLTPTTLQLMDYFDDFRNGRKTLLKHVYSLLCKTEQPFMFLS